MYAIRVQRGVPMPHIKPRGCGGRRTPLYPWDDMQVGDSFLFPDRIGRAAYAAAIQASKNGRTFKALRIEDGFRCWRVA